MHKLKNDDLDFLLSVDSWELESLLRDLPKKKQRTVLNALEDRLREQDPDWIAERLHRFVKAAWHVVEPAKEFVDGRHIQAMCEHLEAVSSGEIKRLIITVPYRCSKSITALVLWPAWEWAKQPSSQYLCLSHSLEMATRDTRRMRMLCRSSWYQSKWPIGFAKDQNLKQYFENDENGYRIAAGMTTGVMGKGADRIVIDDAVDIGDTYSEVKLKTIHGHYDEEISRRLNVPGESAIVVIGQRVHEDDLVGHLLNKTGDDWDLLCIPMRYEEGHPFQRVTSIGWKDWRTRDGELMCPERFPEEWVAAEEKKPGSAGQLQQRPSPRGGGMFRRDWFQFVQAAPRRAARVRAWDKASSHDSGDWTAGVLMAEWDGVFYVEDVIRAQLTPGARNKLIKATATMDAQRYGNTVHVVVEQEPGAGGKFDALTSVKDLAGVPCSIDRVSGSKEVRAAPLAAQFEVGNVFLLNADWNIDYMRELESFPASRHDDQVDASSSAFKALASAEGWWSDEESIASGEDPADERRPLTEEELNDPDLPDYIRDLVVGTRELAEDRAEWEADQQFDNDDYWGY